MKKVIFILLIFVGSLKGQACSFIAKSPFEVFKDLDQLFEGKIEAVYLDDTLVRLRDAHNLLDLSEKRVHVRLKIIPTKIYIGDHKKFFEVHAYYDRHGLCNFGHPFSFQQTIWGTTKWNGAFGELEYINYWTNTARSLIEASQEYQKTLEEMDTTQLTSYGQRFIDSERKLLRRILDGDQSVIELAFIANPAILKELPENFLEHRLKFLEDSGFSPNFIVNTHSAILMKQ